MKNIIEIKNLSFSYDEDREILSNITMLIPAGKITAIMGGSGSGKTTILKLISGQLRPSAGTLQVFDKMISGISAKNLAEIRKKMGVLFQFGALFTDLNISDNIAFPILEHTKLPKEIIDIIVALKLESVGLSGTQNLMPDKLSGGMARRIALARAMAMDPQLMLYDEPFTGLDPISLSTIAMLIKTMNTNLKQTSVIVSHDISKTFEIADYVYFMSNGKIIAHGTTEEIKNTSNAAVKQFINGAVNGPFAYKYPSTKSYQEYLGINN